MKLDLRGPAPKDIAENIAYRKRVIAKAAGNHEFQRLCWIRAARDPVWYCDTFCWTYSPKSFPDYPIRPFVLWNFQEAALKQMVAAIGVHDAIIKKSRDMGASWLCLLAFEWRWHFKKSQAFTLISRVQDLVDKKNEPDCLFWKIDFLHQHQPKWLVPNFDRNSLSKLNEDNNSGLNGASTTGDAGRGGRRVGMLLDEFAAVLDGYDMLAATRDNTNSRIINSTPKGAAGAYADQVYRMEKNHPEYIITMHWSQHPLKSPGLYRVKGGVIEVIDKEYHRIHPGYQFVTSGPFFWDGELRSVWYDGECERAASPQEIAQELDMKMAESAYQYFDQAVLTKLRSQCTPPVVRGEMVWDDDWKTARWDEAPNGRVLLWQKPDAAGNVPWSDIVIGCDVATGKGGDQSSNSVASLVRSSTGEKIGEFTVNTLSPFEFCEYVLALCKWCNHAFLIYEDNGPGAEFTRRLRNGTYGNVYWRDADEKAIHRRKTRKLGFSATPDSKKALLADYRNALVSQRFTNPCDEALVECGQYEVLLTGEISHSRALAAQDPNARGKNHGDRVIADALSWRACQEQGRAVIIPMVKNNVPVNCGASRRAQREKMAREQEWA